mmetsp:Transcript_25361/g.80238  ORF Transcript_25361/g.80238 Transcript_25361/m.80238 type:complete len:355 (-) Transcript_25361:298-1362(-)
MLVALSRPAPLALSSRAPGAPSSAPPAGRPAACTPSCRAGSQHQLRPRSRTTWARLQPRSSWTSPGSPQGPAPSGRTRPPPTLSPASRMRRSARVVTFSWRPLRGRALTCSSPTLAARPWRSTRLSPAPKPSPTSSAATSRARCLPPRATPRVPAGWVCALPPPALAPQTWSLASLTPCSTRCPWWPSVRTRGISTWRSPTTPRLRLAPSPSPRTPTSSRAWSVSSLRRTARRWPLRARLSSRPLLLLRASSSVCACGTGPTIPRVRPTSRRRAATSPPPPTARPRSPSPTSTPTLCFTRSPPSPLLRPPLLPPRPCPLLLPSLLPRSLPPSTPRRRLRPPPHLRVAAAAATWC